MKLAQVDVRKTGGGVCFKADVFPNTDRRKFGPPIPSELARRLANRWPARQRVRGRRQTADGFLLGDVLRTRCEVHPQFVALCHEQILDVPAVLAEHVHGAAQLAPIQADSRQGVEPVAGEPDVRLAQQFGRDIKRLAIFPISFGNPLHSPLIVPHKRVGDASEGKQICVRTAWDRGRQPFFSPPLGVPCLVGYCLAKLPGACQRLRLRHLLSFGLMFSPRLPARTGNPGG